MSTPESNMQRERLDQATSRRLAKLRATPVDLANLTNAIARQIPRPADAARFRLRWARPLQAVAASLLVLGLIAVLVISSSSRPVLASPQRLAEIHAEVVSGRSQSTQVASMDAARSVLAEKWPGAPTMPEISAGNVSSCCIHMLGRKKVASVSVQSDGTHLTLVVADAAEIKQPEAPTMTVGGITYRVQSHNGVNMLMTEHEGRWVCLMGRLPPQRLTEIAGTMRF